MLELQSIGKRVGSMAMRDVSFEIHEGEYLVLLGPSGVGKTILIEIIAGLIQPDCGKILWDGKDITFTPPQARRFSVVYQQYALFPHLTVSGNIVYGLKAAGAAPSVIQERLQSLTEMLGIESLLNRYPSKLSGGEQQRVALARALAPQPRLLLLDEPLSALDTNTRQRLRKELKRISKAPGISVLHVTHDPEEAMALGDKVAVMLNHEIRQVAGVEELFRRPSDAEVAEFLGMKNVLPVSMVKGDVCVVCGQEVYVSSAEDSTCHIWIGPEEILLSLRPFDSSARNQFKCKVVGWEHHNSLFAVAVAANELGMTALITHSSFEQLEIAVGREIYATFKSSAVHCF